MARSLETLGRLLEQSEEANAGRMALEFPTHGDLASQNFRRGPDGMLFALDLEGFQFSPYNLDLAKFRMRLERYLFRGPFARSRATRLWQRFADAFEDSGEGEAFPLLCYARWLLAHLAWLRDPNTGTTAAGSSLSTRLQSGLWAQNRLRWLSQLPDQLPQALRYFRQRL